MKLIFSPQRRDDALTLSKAGDVLTINGVAFDFSAVPDGATLPADAIDCPWIAGDVKRIDGDLQIPIILPHGANPAKDVAFPDPLTITSDGAVALPGKDA